MRSSASTMHLLDCLLVLLHVNYMSEVSCVFRGKKTKIVLLLSCPVNHLTSLNLLLTCDVMHAFVLSLLFLVLLLLFLSLPCKVPLINL